MSWNREGKKLLISYNGDIVSGVVTESRVTYGNVVKHYVALSKPWTSRSGEVRTEISIKDDQILSVL